MDRIDDKCVLDGDTAGKLLKESNTNRKNVRTKKGVLKSKQAVELWHKGKEIWNHWAKGHDGWDVDFSGVDFGQLRQQKNSIISFKGFIFPGQTLFSDAQFGEGHVSFDFAQFIEGSVNFYRAQFKAGDVSFKGAFFGSGTVSFHFSQFGHGKVSFTDAQFGDADITFSNAQFGDGGLCFRFAQFGSVDISFNNARFSNGDVSFKRALFRGGRASFLGAEFGEGRFDFSPDDVSKCDSIDFSGAVISSALNLSGIKTDAVVNLSQTALKFPVDLGETQLNFKTESYYRVFKRATNHSYSMAFRRLKKLAKETGDYERALDFFAKEKRSAYWHSINGPILVLYYLYDIISDYGRSIIRPLVVLSFCWVVFAGVYVGVSNCDLNEDSIKSALVLSGGQAVPFYLGAKEDRSDGKRRLYGGGYTPDSVRVVALSQSALSIMLIFLMSLGLRNRFRQ